MKLSNCCNAPLAFETDCICSECFEGCAFYIEETTDENKKKIDGREEKNTDQAQKD